VLIRVDRRGRYFVQPEQAVLPQRDAHLRDPQQLAIGGGHRLLQDAQRIVGVQDRETRLQTKPHGDTAQHLHAERVEGNDQRALSFAQSRCRLAR